MRSNLKMRENSETIKEKTNISEYTLRYTLKIKMKIYT